MKRILVTDRQMELLEELRDKGRNWTQIAEEPEFKGLSRHVLKRRFDERQEARQAISVESVRQGYAAKRYEEHISSLVWLAKACVRILEPPEERDLKTGDGVLRDINYGFDGRSVLDMDLTLNLAAFDVRRIYTRNTLLMKSLRDHTRGVVDWSSFDEWIKARNAWVKSRVRLDRDAREVFVNVCSNKGLVPRRMKLDDPLLDSLVREIARTVRRRAERRAMGIREVDRAATEHCDAMGHSRDLVSTVVDSRGVVLEFHDALGVDVKSREESVEATESDNALEEQMKEAQEIADELCSCCLKAIGHLETGIEERTVTAAENAYATMWRSFLALEEQLEEYRLVPVLIRTRCEICPA